MRKIIHALLFIVLATLPASAQVKTTYTLFSGVQSQVYTYQGYFCGGSICPQQVPVDFNGVPLFGLAGAPSTEALTVQGIAGGQPVIVNCTIGCGGGGGSGAITAAASSYASGAFSVGAGTDGWNVTEGTKADAAWTSGSGSIVAVLKAISGFLSTIATAVTSALPQGSFWIGATDIVVTPSANFTRPANTTAYSIGQLVANSTSSGLVVPMSWTAARVTGGNGYVRRFRMTLSSKSVTNTSFRLHLFTVTPGTITNGDGGTLSVTEANEFCEMDVTIANAGADVSNGYGVPSSGNGNECNFVAAGGSQTIYGLLEARAAYTPGSAETITVVPEIHQN